MNSDFWKLTLICLDAITFFYHIGQPNLVAIGIFYPLEAPFGIEIERP